MDRNTDICWCTSVLFRLRFMAPSFRQKYVDVQAVLNSHLTACDCCPVEQRWRRKPLTSGRACNHRPFLLLLTFVGDTSVPECGRPARRCSSATRGVRATGKRNRCRVFARCITAWRRFCQVIPAYTHVRAPLWPISPSALFQPSWGALTARSVQPWSHLAFPPALDLQSGRNKIGAGGGHLFE